MRLLATVLILTLTSQLNAETVYVNPKATVAPQAVLDALEPGDTCVFQAGVYRDSLRVNVSGTAENPIKIIAKPGVMLDGTDAITTPWTKHGTSYRTPLPGPLVEQVFENGSPLTPARWPNATFSETWIRSKWASSTEDSKKDLMVCDALAETDIDWTGAMAVLNVGHQYKTWTRTVLSHQKGSRQFTYKLSERLGDGRDEGKTWWDDRFFLTGTIKALDAAGEWYHDADEGYLYVMTEHGGPPDLGDIAVKRRNYGIFGTSVKQVLLSGFHFHGCTVRINEADHVTIQDCQIRFPQFTFEIGETLPAGQRRSTPHTGVSGNDNTIRRLLVAYGSGIGIATSGCGNRIEDCLVHDVAWSGTINFPGIALTSLKDDSGRGGTVSRCEVFNTGNIGIQYRGPSNVIEWNHVHHTGLACRDIAAIHTGSPNARGSIARYNWVHHSMGKGIRGDDQTRGLTVHHNLVWACDEGIIVKGDENTVYHNTILGADGHGTLLIPTREEPKKWWTAHEILPIQNLNSRFFNNYCEEVVYRNDPIPQNVDITHNYSSSTDESFGAALADVTPSALDRGNFDPRPRPGTTLVDAGVFVEHLTDDYTGTAPDPGAYEQGYPLWRPGPSWTAPADLVLEIKAEVARSHQLNKPSSIPLPARLRTSALRESTLRELQALYDSCWTAAAMKQRREAISNRQKFPEGSPAYRAHHAIVVELHRAATQSLLEKATSVLSRAEMDILQQTMSPTR